AQPPALQAPQARASLLMLRFSLLLLAALALAAPASAASLAEHEANVRRAAAALGALRAQRDALAGQASALAEQITDAKARASEVRAGPELTALLRRFDRLATDLDDLDRRLSQQQSEVERARDAFRRAADAEAARLAPQSVVESISTEPVP